MIVAFSHLRKALLTWAATIFLIAVICPISSGIAQEATQTKTDDEKAKELMELNNKKHVFQDLLNGDPEAVAIDKQVFALSTDPELKERIGSILISIGVKDQAYFDYLAKAAKQALDNDVPWPSLYDERGRINHKADHPAFVAWCKKHGLDPKDERNAPLRTANPEFLDWCIAHDVRPMNARHDSYYEIPLPWYFVAAAHDPRFYDLLMQGLHSHNLMIAGWAAEGLVRLQDPKALDELIAVGRRMPAEISFMFATSLVRLPDPKAQAAAEEIADAFGDRKMWELFRDDAKKKGVNGLFEW